MGFSLINGATFALCLFERFIYNGAQVNTYYPSYDIEA